MSGTRLWYGTGTEWVRLSGPDDGVTPDPEPTVSHDWSESNLPWAYTSTSEFTADWPAGTNIVPLAGTAGQDLATRLNATMSATSGRIVVELPEGVFQFTSINKIGTGSDDLYAFAYWNSRLQGLLGQGPDKTFVRLAANSITQTQLNLMSQLDPAAFAQMSLGVARLDGSSSSKVLLAGITFDAYDQPNLTSVHANMTNGSAGLPVVVPQPAPHQGITIYPGSHAIVSYCRFQGTARAMNSRPPFELANLGTYRTSTVIHHVESDGRLSPSINPLRPRRGGVLMGGNETMHQLTDCWLHHSNVSRYAVNDQNTPYTTGDYSSTRTKVDHITDNQNKDPNLNGGNSLGGYTDATPYGWESCNGTITIVDPIISQDNPKTGTSGQVPMIFQLTSVGNHNPQGGRMYVHGGTFTWAHSILNGWVGFRILATTFWWTDGFDNTLFVYHRDGQRLSPWVHTGSTWPPTAAQISAAGVSPETHYIIRGA